MQCQFAKTSREFALFYYYTILHDFYMLAILSTPAAHKGETSRNHAITRDSDMGEVNIVESNTCCDERPDIVCARQPPATVGLQPGRRRGPQRGRRRKRLRRMLLSS
ncbi:hypothetical protein EVAR_60834_1 [Eumeta japonica]|uniref:Uncharacterized protein n=1 Tax=Eumeta variegata TaxID=151549 RepID=A0A4C1Y9H9_EUMVA|nr:hypothetical protein EVAR_60834_1 [Eumeta japonica]